MAILMSATTRRARVNIILAIEKNGTEIGTITFVAGGGGQDGEFEIAAAMDFIEGDRYALRATQSDNSTRRGYR